jgi:aryl-alcohol dehydrogenase-like predicted oxidoreductase
MELRLLGSTGVRVSPLCLGAMLFGRWGNPDEADAIRIIDRALDAGINFIDTADVYGHGDSEEILGKALKGSKRDRIVLATKVNHQMGDGANRAGNSRRWIMQEVEDSLRRLNTDWIDLYQVHRPDPTCDMVETLGALTDLVRSGKVRYIGSSTFAAHEIVEAQWAAERRHLERFVCEQPPYSILVRGIEEHVLAVCQKHRMGVITWSPLCAGWLTGLYRKGRTLPTASRYELIPERYDLEVTGNRAKLDAVEELAVLAGEAGLTLIQLALGFILAHPAVTSAIAGPRTMEHLEAYLAGADVRLTQDVLDRIDRIVPRRTTFTEADAR